MIEVLGKYRRVFLLSGIGICVLAIVLTINPSVPNILQRGLSYVVTPLQRGGSGLVFWVRGHFGALANNQALLREIAYLQEANNILMIENYRLQLAGEENATLSDLLDMNRRYAHLATMGARVIGVNPNDWYSRFFIDRGSDDGITNNMAVIGNGGLLGVVRQVHSGRAQFISIVDIDFSAAVMSRRTGDIGSTSSSITLMQQGLIRMERIDAAAQIMPGDEIVTSTHSSIFPPGILVGVVEAIYPNPDGLTRHAIIRPAAQLDNIEMVLIVTETPGDVYATRDGHTFVAE